MLDVYVLFKLDESQTKLEQFAWKATVFETLFHFFNILVANNCDMIFSIMKTKNTGNH